jgi:hypothetical protein
MLIMGPGQYEFDSAIVESDFLPVTAAVAEEMAAGGRELLHDVPVHNAHGDYR